MKVFTDPTLNFILACFLGAIIGILGGYLKSKHKSS